MRKVILILLVFVSAKVSAQVYQEMPQYGYRANRMAFDSTLQIPTFCGVPTLRSVVKANKNGAIAFDSCNNKLYQYNPKTLTWSEISGGTSTDTTSLSNRINLKVDSIRRVSDSVFAWINGVRVFQFTDSVGSGGGDFWKTSGITDLTSNVTIRSDNSIQFVGIDDELQTFGINAVNFNYSLQGGEYLIEGLTQQTDTSFYKPLVIGTDNNIKRFPYWVGGGASDTIYTQSPIMYITRNDSNIIFFNADTANVWRSANDTAKVVIAQVHNATATTLLKGEVVYLFGSTGNIASVKRANNKQDSTSSKTLGLIRRDIPAGGTGFVTTQGQIEKLNLGSYAEGDVLWLDSIDGQFTKVKPQAPYHGVFLGIVERANNGNGLAYIKVQNGYELGEIHDVQINNILNNQIIVYSDTQQVWKNRNISSLIDTTVLQPKSIPSYTFLANNTTATANAQALPFKDTSGTYTQSPTWTGTAPTSGNLSYRWTRIGKMVTINISLIYAVAGSGNSILTVPLPTGAPIPTKPAGLTSALNNLYPITGSVNLTSSSTLTNSATRGFLRNNTANDGFEFIVNFSATAAAINAHITCTYFTD